MKDTLRVLSETANNHSLQVAKAQQVMDELMRDVERGAVVRIGGSLPKRQPIKYQRAKVGRNELCPCQSGKKFKNCCLIVLQNRK